MPSGDRRTGGTARSNSRNSPNEVKEGQNVRSANGLHPASRGRDSQDQRLRISFTGLGPFWDGFRASHDRMEKILYPQSLKMVNSRHDQTNAQGSRR